MKKLLTLTCGLLFLSLLFACGSTTKPGTEYTGVLKEQGFTTYQYGTHTLTHGNNLYALKSDSLDLNAYVNQEVSLRAEKVEGYPVDGGPEYLNVLEISKVK